MLGVKDDNDRLTAAGHEVDDCDLYGEGFNPVLCFLVWCFGLPAILKGFMDRVMIPGVSFRRDENAKYRRNLAHIRSVAAVVTYGRARLESMYFGIRHVGSSPYISNSSCRDMQRLPTSRNITWQSNKEKGMSLHRFHHRVARYMERFDGQ